MTEREDLLENVEAVLRYDNEDVWEVLQSVRDYLKAQEPVEPKAMQEGWYCSNCGGTVGFFDYSGDKVCGEITYNYCPDCGRKVKWDD